MRLPYLSDVLFILNAVLLFFSSFLKDYNINIVTPNGTKADHFALNS